MTGNAVFFGADVFSAPVCLVIDVDEVDDDDFVTDGCTCLVVEPDLSFSTFFFVVVTSAGASLGSVAVSASTTPVTI